MGALELFLGSHYSTWWYIKMTSDGQVMLLSVLEGEMAINFCQ